MPEKAQATHVSEPKSDEGSPSNQQLIFYPAYCYKASPTWFTWVKLTALTVHIHLNEQSEFRTVPSYVTTEGGWIQNQTLLLFYLNHPIQFVQLVGVVVAFEEYLEKIWLFTLDDSSGATIDVICRKPLKGGGEDPSTSTKEQEKDEDAETRYQRMLELDIGAVVQVKGMVTTFRNVRQLQLERISFMRETNQEMRVINARTNFHRQVLSLPWQLSPAKLQALKAQALGEAKRHKSRPYRRQRMLQAKLEREKRHERKILRDYEREEVKRLAGATEAQEAAHGM